MPQSHATILAQKSNEEYIAKQIELPPHFGLLATELGSLSRADSDSPCKFRLLKIAALEGPRKHRLRFMTTI